MAASLLRWYAFAPNTLRLFSVPVVPVALDACARVSIVPVTQYFPTPLLNEQPHRYTSFFNKLPAEQIWKGVTSVSNAGKKRGRGKGVGKQRSKNLNKGQVIGVGKANIMWPGLNVPVMRGRELVKQQQLPEDKEREEKLLKMRDQMGVFRALKLLPTERGWSGTKLPGRSIGPPDPIGEDNFEGFDTKVLEMKTVFCMKGNLGRKRRLSILAVTGNKQGLAGIALGKAVETPSALRKAKNRAGQKLMFFERYNEHTVLHDFFTQYGKTKVFVTKVPEGYGLVCHRAIRAVCEVIGIKDIYAKVEGPTNLQHIVKAFLIGLLRQKTHMQLSEEKGMHLVELREENGNFPKIVASPSKCRTIEEIPPSEVLDFRQHVMENRVVLQRKKWPVFYTQLPSWQKHLKKTVWRRNHDDVRLRMYIEHGELRSFLTDKYPEAKPKLFKKVRQVEEEAEAVEQ